MLYIYLPVLYYHGNLHVTEEAYAGGRGFPLSSGLSCYSCCCSASSSSCGGGGVVLVVVVVVVVIIIIIIIIIISISIIIPLAWRSPLPLIILYLDNLLFSVGTVLHIGTTTQVCRV